MASTASSLGVSAKQDITGILPVDRTDNHGIRILFHAGETVVSPRWNTCFTRMKQNSFQVQQTRLPISLSRRLLLLIRNPPGRGSIVVSMLISPVVPGRMPRLLYDRMVAPAFDGSNDTKQFFSGMLFAVDRFRTSKTPLVSVPVLSNTTVLILVMASR